MSKYIQDQTRVWKKYLLTALNRTNQYLSYLDERLGTSLQSTDIRNCELLTDALLFREEVKLTRDGRNRYKIFYLTDLGKEMAQRIKEEGYSDEMPETAQIITP